MKNYLNNRPAALIKICLVILLLTLVFGWKVGKGQSPKTHIYYDTLKTINERVDYTPDTIAVWFKEIVFMKLKVYDVYNTKTLNIPRDSIGIEEKWTKGFVIWQTYKKVSTNSVFTNSGTHTGNVIYSNFPDYYKDEYTPTKFTDNKFLYADRKTKVTNRVIYTILR